MKNLLLLSVGVVALALQSASAQTVTNLINSFENSTEGWTTFEGNWTTGGFSTTLGVTQGSTSLILNAATAPDYGGAFGGTASTALTLDLANAVAVKFDVLATGFSYMQWDLTINGGGVGYQSVDGYSYSQSPTIGAETTLTFTIPSAYQATLAANPTTPTSLNFQIGEGSGNPGGTVYLDNIRIIDAVPEPTTLALLGVGALGLWTFGRRRS